jgi:hypothetical protein
MVRWLATLAVLSHAMVAYFHGTAHKQLGVGLEPWERWFVDVVILGAPLVALVLIWTRLTRCGFLVLAISMFGALVFGVYHHYGAISPDHVAHLPPGEAQTLFKTTAVLLVVTEALGLGAGIWGWLAGRAK